MALVRSRFSQMVKLLKDDAVLDSYDALYDFLDNLFFGVPLSKDYEELPETTFDFYLDCDRTDYDSTRIIFDELRVLKHPLNMV